MISVRQRGNFKRTEKYLKKSFGKDYIGQLAKYGEQGVVALSSATPVDTGKTALLWYYKILKTKSGYSIVWCNSGIENGFPVAIMLQYGHATKNGGWVEGIDYINPALKPIFEDLANKAWKEVTS